MYYAMGTMGVRVLGTMWNIQGNHDSWMVRKILQTYKVLEPLGWN